MKKYISTLIQIAPWYLEKVAKDGFKTAHKIPLPVKMGKYGLIKNVSKGSTPFATGVYRDETGKKVIIKIWRGTQKSVHYFNLVHQIEVTKILSKVQDRLTFEEKHNFALPKYISSKTGPHEAILIMEFVSGKPMEGMTNIKKEWKIYQECLAFLKVLSEKCSNDEKELITIKSYSDFLFLSFFIYPMAILMQPKLFGLLLKSWKVFLDGLFDLAHMTPTRLVHGDLHPDNILIGTTKYFLIDIENVRFCYPDYEPATSISLRGNPPKLKNLIFNNLLVNHFDRPAQKRAKAALMVNNAIHNMSGDTRQENVACYVDVLHLAQALPKL